MGLERRAHLTNGLEQQHLAGHELIGCLQLIDGDERGRRHAEAAAHGKYRFAGLDAVRGSGGRGQGWQRCRHRG
jgi:hypothetical protein